MTGEELRTRREQLGLSQSQLAVALKRHHDTISKWERGVLAIESPGVLRFLLDALAQDSARFGADREEFLRRLETFIPAE